MTSTQIALDELLKTCEQVEFENSVFESFYARELGHFELKPMSDDDYRDFTEMSLGNMSDIRSLVSALMDGAKKTNVVGAMASPRNKNGDKIKQLNRLTAERKCIIITHETDELDRRTELVKQDCERIVDHFRAIIEELELKKGDISKAYCDFERDMKSSLNDRTKKYQAEKLQRYFDEKKRAKEALIKKLRLKTATMAVQKKKVSLQLRQKEEMGEVLHEVDFEQLDIENKQYLEKMDEKNEELLDLKQRATNTTVFLNGKKTQMQELNDRNQTTSQEIKIRTENLRRLKGEMEQVKEEVGDAAAQLQKLKAKMDDYEVPPPADYISQKSNLDELRQITKTWIRKVEIADMKLSSVQNKWRLMCCKHNANGSGDSLNHSQQLSSSVSN